MTAAPDIRFLLPAGGHAVEGRAAGGTAIATLPDAATMRAAAPLAHRRALAHAMGRALAPTPRNRAIALVARSGLLARVLPQVTVTPEGLPAFVALAADLGVPASEWSLVLAGGLRDRKSAFYLFDPEGDAPYAVAKFRRTPGHDAHFDKVERGLRLVAGAPPEVRGVAPRLLARGELHGHHVIVESAANGASLERSLTGKASRPRKLEEVERVVSWLRDVSTATTAGAGAGDIAGEVERVRRDVLPHAPVPLGDALAAAGRSPAVLVHGDLWEANVILRDGTFTVLDWDDARAGGFPLWDLLYFALNALPLIDGARLQDEKERMAKALVEGTAPSSPLLLSWLRAAAGAVGLSMDDVGPILALCMADWLVTRVPADPSELESWFLPRVARWWLTTFAAGWPPS